MCLPLEKRSIYDTETRSRDAHRVRRELRKVRDDVDARAHRSVRRRLDPLQGVSPASSKNVGCSRVFLGDVDVFERVLGFTRSDHLTAKVLHEELWKTPVVAAAFRTRAVWFDLPDEVVNSVSPSTR